MSHWPTCIVGALCPLSKLLFCHLCAFAMFFSAISLTSSSCAGDAVTYSRSCFCGWICTSCPRPAYHRQINGKSCFPPKHQVEWSKSSAVVCDGAVCKQHGLDVTLPFCLCIVYLLKCVHQSMVHTFRKSIGLWAGCSSNLMLGICICIEVSTSLIHKLSSLI